MFTTRPGVLVDEYGQRVDDPVGWLDGLAAPDEAQIKWKHDHSGPFRSEYHDERQHRDPDGFRFSAYEFS